MKSKSKAKRAGINQFRAPTRICGAPGYLLRVETRVGLARSTVDRLKRSRAKIVHDPANTSPRMPRKM